MIANHIHDAIGQVRRMRELALWFLGNPLLRRDLMQLKPAADALPVLSMGTVFGLGELAGGFILYRNLLEEPDA